MPEKGEQEEQQRLPPAVAEVVPAAAALTAQKPGQIERRDVHFVIKLDADCAVC